MKCTIPTSTPASSCITAAGAAQYRVARDGTRRVLRVVARRRRRARHPRHRRSRALLPAEDGGFEPPRAFTQPPSKWPGGVSGRCGRTRLGRSAACARRLARQGWSGGKLLPPFCRCARAPRWSRAPCSGRDHLATTAEFKSAYPVWRGSTPGVAGRCCACRGNSTSRSAVPTASASHAYRAPLGSTIVPTRPATRSAVTPSAWSRSHRAAGVDCER